MVHTERKKKSFKKYLILVLIKPIYHPAVPMGLFMARIVFSALLGAGLFVLDKS